MIGNIFVLNFNEIVISLAVLATDELMTYDIRYSTKTHIQSLVKVNKLTVKAVCEREMKILK